MKKLIIALALLSLAIAPAINSIYDFTMDNINGDPVSLSKYKGKVILVVNVASKCGFTPQYKDLEALYEEKEKDGLVILGFPANNFAGQEPGTNDEIEAFCEKNYGVTFPMFSKISVKGDDMHPLYHFITEKELNGVMDSEVKWNFQKYLFDRNGKLVTMIPSRISVSDSDVKSEIEALLSASK